MAIQDDAKQFFLTELSRSQGDLPSLELEWLASEGYTRGSIDERWSYYLRDNGQPPTGVSWDLLGLTRNKGGGGWTPAQLFAAGQKGAWWEPFRASTLAQASDGTGAVSADADPVGWMRDLSPNGRTAIQATADNRMLFRPSVYNGLGGIEGAVAGKQLVAASVFDSSFNTAFSLYGVVKRPFSSSTKVWASHGGARLYAGTTGFSTPTINTSQLSDTQITSTKADGDIALVSFRYDGTTKKIRSIGPEKQTSNTEAATGNMGLSGNLTIGDLSTGSFHWDGQVCAMLIVNEALSDDEDYLTCKYFRDLFHLSHNAIVCCDGNSLTFGTGASDPATESYPAQLATFQPSWTVKNFGVPSATTAQRAAAAATGIKTFYGLGRPKNVAVLWEITNDLYLNEPATSDAAIAAYVAWCLDVQSAGFQVVAVNVAPRTGGSPYANFETHRLEANAYLDANWPDFADALVDVSDLSPGSGDGIHFSAAQYTVIASRVNAAIATL